MSLPGGPHFTKITIECLTEDLKSTMDLVSRCSDTLESFSAYCYAPGVSLVGFYKWSIPCRYL